jgi:O-antigen ligase
VPDTEGRLTLWQVAERMAKDRPVEGVGLGSFQASAPSYLLEPGVLTRTDQIIDTPKEVHNIYLQALAETGIIGLVLFLLVLGFFLRCGVQAARNFARSGDVQMEILARAVVIALIGILTADFFVPEQYSKLLWLMLGLGPALLAISQSPEESSVKRYAPAPRLMPASSS